MNTTPQNNNRTSNSVRRHLDPESAILLRLIHITLILSLVASSCPGVTNAQDRSGGSGNPVEVTFVNQREQPVDIYWVDFQGNEQMYGTIAPRQSHRQPTGAGHVWRFKSAGETVATYQASEVQVQQFAVQQQAADPATNSTNQAMAVSRVPLWVRFENKHSAPVFVESPGPDGQWRKIMPTTVRPNVPIDIQFTPGTTYRFTDENTGAEIGKYTATEAEGQSVAAGSAMVMPQGGSGPAHEYFESQQDWYDTKDQYGDIGTPASRPWADANNPIPKMDGNRFGYYAPNMHPYKLAFRGTERQTAIFESPAQESTDYYTGDYAIPNMFIFRTMVGYGKSDLSGQVFFSETERQNAFQASASVEGGAMGTSVGVSGSYGQERAQSSAQGTTSVFASAHELTYWLTLNKRDIKLSSAFRDKVINESGDPAAFMRRYGSHYPVAGLYGGRIYYDEAVDSKKFSESISTNWDAEVSGSTSISGVDIAVSASYGQTNRNASSNELTLNTVKLETIGGQGVTSYEGWSVDPASPTLIRVELRPIYELIRPEFFPGVEIDVVYDRHMKLKQAYESILGQGQASMPLNPYIRKTFDLDPLRVARRNRDIREKRLPDGQKIMESYPDAGTANGKPLLFTFWVTAGGVKLTDQLGRPIVTRNAGPKKTEAIMTIVPTVKKDASGQEYFDYELDRFITISGTWKDRDLQETVSGRFKLEDVTRQNSLLVQGKYWSAGADVRVAPMSSISSNYDGLPLPPWEWNQ